MAATQVSEEEFPTFTSARTGPPDLRLLHYNDVYHISLGSREPIGGISRFQPLCNHYTSSPHFATQPKLLTLFSGDAFNPSLESSVTKGSHMVPILNSTRISAACLGNHDLDFGMEQFAHLAAKCTFPWLCANVLDPALGDDVPLGNCKRTVMLSSSNGIKVGVIGLVEREWLETINALPPGLKYLSASATAAELVPELREQGAEIVVAVTHQRQPNDEKLARKLPEGFIDLILGGHDHTYEHCVVNGMHLLRSGTDFKQLSYIEAYRKVDGKGWDFNITRRDVVATKSIVSEENGLLISTIMRQYFMSLKIIGRWKKWGSEMGRHWRGVQEEMGEAGNVVALRKQNGEAIPTSSIPAQSTTTTDFDGAHDADADSDDETSPRDNLPAVPIELPEDERRGILMRKFLRKWWRLAGLQGHPGCGGEEEGGVSWTRGVAPRVEGRVRCLA